MTSVRPATISDSEDIFNWRNDKHTRLMSINSQPVTINEHENWFSNTLENNSRCLLICEGQAHEKIGVTRFDMLNETAEISINIAPEHRGKGLAIACLNSSIAYFKSNFNSYNTLTATIKENNPSSKKCFIVVGFSLTATRDNMQYYSLKIG